MENKELNIIINEINELKLLIKNNDRLKYIINDLNNELLNINSLLNKNNTELNKNSEIKTLFTKYIDNNNLINSNYNKLINKPINLIEIIINAIKSGDDISADIENISGAVDKIKSFENNKIDSIVLENKDIILQLNNELEKLNNSNDNDNIAAISSSLIEINNNLKNIKLLIDNSSDNDSENNNVEEIESENNNSLDITIDSIKKEEDFNIDDETIDDELNKDTDDFYNV